MPLKWELCGAFDVHRASPRALQWYQQCPLWPKSQGDLRWGYKQNKTKQTSFFMY